MPQHDPATARETVERPRGGRADEGRWEKEPMVSGDWWRWGEQPGGRQTEAVAGGWQAAAGAWRQAPLPLFTWPAQLAGWLPGSQCKVWLLPPWAVVVGPGGSWKPKTNHLLFTWLAQLVSHWVQQLLWLRRKPMLMVCPIHLRELMKLIQ